MNKRYLPVIAAVLIAITCTAFLPVFAQVSTLPSLPTFIYAAPTLTVVTIAQDDQARHTGVMWLADSEADFATLTGGSLVSQYKVLVAYNGVPVVPSSTYCQFVEKDKSEPLKNKQGPWETLATSPIDMSANFLCKFRWGKPGVGVIDVYYIGAGTAASIADYVMIVGINFVVGRSTVYGSDMQDLCVLGWPIGFTGDVMGTLTTAAVPYAPLTGVSLVKPIYTDPLGLWKSCEDLALMQKQAELVPIQWS